MEALDHVLARLYRRLGLEGELAGARAVEVWPRVVGPRVASHARAVGFQNGVLRVEVEGSAWMHELSFLKHQVLQAINRELGSRRVRDVRFVVPRQGETR